MLNSAATSVEAQLDPLQQDRMIDQHVAFDRGNRSPAEATIRGHQLELLTAVAFDRRVDFVEELEELQRLARGDFFRSPVIPLRGPVLEVLDSLGVVRKRIVSAAPSAPAALRLSAK